VSDIVERLMRFDGHKCISSDVEVESADLIERQREALRVAREALSDTRARLSIERKKLGEAYGYSCMGVFYCDAEAKEIDEALAAIDAVLKETGE